MQRATINEEMEVLQDAPNYKAQKSLKVQDPIHYFTFYHQETQCFEHRSKCFRLIFLEMINVVLCRRSLTKQMQMIAQFHHRTN
jgi:hypothetical protein